MLRISTLSLAILLSSAALAAQSPVPNSAPNPWQAQPEKRVFHYQFTDPAGSSPSQLFAILNPTGPSCPVTMRAEHRSSGSVMTAGAGVVSGIGQRIHLVFGETGIPARVTAAKVTVHGTNGQWRVTTATTRQTQQGSPYITRTLYPVFTHDRDDTESTELDLPGFTSVKSIRLDSITYADGSTWTAPDGGGCRVEPDPFMLVSSR
jgi:hypothetical protein